MLIHYRGKEAWFAEGEYPVESDQYLLKMVIEALPEAPPPEIRIDDDVAYWTRTWMDESSVEYMMNVQGPTFAECLEVARSAETMTMKSVNPKGRASTSAKRARKTVKVESSLLSRCSRGYSSVREKWWHKTVCLDCGSATG